MTHHGRLDAFSVGPGGGGNASGNNSSESGNSGDMPPLLRSASSRPHGERHPATGTGAGRRLATLPSSPWDHHVSSAPGGERTRASWPRGGTAEDSATGIGGCSSHEALDWPAPGSEDAAGAPSCRELEELRVSLSPVSVCGCHLSEAVSAFDVRLRSQQQQQHWDQRRWAKGKGAEVHGRTTEASVMAQSKVGAP